MKNQNILSPCRIAIIEKLENATGTLIKSQCFIQYVHASFVKEKMFGNSKLVQAIKLALLEHLMSISVLSGNQFPGLHFKDYDVK